MSKLILQQLIQKEIKKALSSPPRQDSISRQISTHSIMSPFDTKEIDLKAEIDRDVENGAYEKAFTTALGSTDLSNVLVRFYYNNYSICVSLLTRRLYLRAVK